MEKPGAKPFIALSLAAGLLILPVRVPAQQEAAESSRQRYHPRRQVLSLKGEILGGEFRVTTALPFRGDFSRYQRIEIVPLRNLIGKDLPDSVLEKYNEKVLAQFRNGARFREVALLNSFQATAPTWEARSLPSRVAALPTMPFLGYAAAGQADGNSAQFVPVQSKGSEPHGAEEPTAIGNQPPPTLQIVGEVLDYRGGNSFLQILPLNLGNSVFTVRFRYYDKLTGVEVGRQVITGEISGASLLGPLRLHSAVTAVAEGLADQVTRRTLAADR